MSLRRAGVLTTALLLAASPAPARPSTPPASAASAASWIAARQAPDGGFFGAAQPADATAEAIAALAAAGTSAARHAISRALVHLQREAPARASRPAYAGRVVMGLVAAGRNARSFGGVDYVERIRQGYHPATGTYETGLYSQALAILGLIAAREPVPAAALTYLRANACPDGGFAHDPGCVPRADSDTTGVVACALAGAGLRRGDAALAGARDWLHRARAGGGGWPHFPGGEANANSTGLAISGLACLGERDAGAQRALEAFQLPSGGMRYDADDAQANSYSTVQAIPALAGIGYPVRPTAATVVAGRKAGPPGRPGTPGGPAAPKPAEGTLLPRAKSSGMSDASDDLARNEHAPLRAGAASSTRVSAPAARDLHPATGLAAVLACAVGAATLRRRRRA